MLRTPAAPASFFYRKAEVLGSSDVITLIECITTTFYSTNIITSRNPLISYYLPQYYTLRQDLQLLYYQYPVVVEDHF